MRCVSSTLPSDFSPDAACLTHCCPPWVSKPKDRAAGVHKLHRHMMHPGMKSFTSAICRRRPPVPYFWPSITAARHSEKLPSSCCSSKWFLGRSLAFRKLASGRKVPRAHSFVHERWREENRHMWRIWNLRVSAKTESSGAGFWT